jgi:chromobox protein 1
VSNIDHIQEVLDPKTGGVKRMAFIHWNDGDDPLHTRHDLMTLYKKCPQKMLRYYESHLVFRNSSAPGAEDEAEAMAGSFENGDGLEE